MFEIYIYIRVLSIMLEKKLHKPMGILDILMK